MINTKTDRKNLYLSLDKLDLISKLRPLLEREYVLRLEDGRFIPRHASLAPDPPWIYVKTANARCDLYNKVFYQHLGHIHSRCRDCWKVVARPRTVVELFDLYELQREMGVPCKCGIEPRESVNGLYGGYFYNRGPEEGFERYKQVRKAVDEQISPDMGVILKRMCTEFELGTPPGGDGTHRPSDTIEDCTLEEIEWEKWVEDQFPRVGFESRQTDIQMAKVMRRWIHHAYQNGDNTYLEFTNGERLFNTVVTYHEKFMEGEQNGNTK